MESKSSLEMQSGLTSRLHKLETFMNRGDATLLAIGPVSVNCIDAAIEIGDENNLPMVLIPSRNQVDADHVGGGYVNNWNTEQFVRYVRENDVNNNLLIARDHGGPWQHASEAARGALLEDAMLSAKKSFKADIDAGFDIIHVDPSVDIHEKISVETALDRVYELYSFCCEEGARFKRSMWFEVGTDEQGIDFEDLERFEFILRSILDFCEREKLQRPRFVVAQTGTKVIEAENLGHFKDLANNRLEELESHMNPLIEICRKNNIWLKEHNTDYLDDHSLQLHPRLGIHSCNVAPEFGVCESRTFVQTLRREGLDSLVDQFLDLAIASGKYKKWLKADTTADEEYRAMLAGHYVFASDAFKGIYREAEGQLSKRNVDLTATLKQAVKESIMRYLRCFGSVKQ